MAFSIDQAKALAAGYQWLLLAKWTFNNGDTLYLSTRDVTFGGQAYLGRLADQDLDTVQSMSESGIDLAPVWTAHIADSDSYVYLNYENGTGRGFRGADVEVKLGFRDVLGNENSTDTMFRFSGVCDPATQAKEEFLIVRAQNRMNASKKMLPMFLMQRHCPKIRPLNASQCAEAADEDSDFWWCGITDPGKPDCNNTREGCISADNFPRFAGVTFQPPRDGGKGREYVSGEKVQLFNSGNDAKYGEPWPVVLGRGWVECPVLWSIQNGNYTDCLVGLCIDAIDTGLDSTLSTRVIANGYELPPAGYDSPGGFVQLNPGNVGWWNWYTRGNRDGLTEIQASALYGGKGDAHGSEVTILVTIPRQISSGEQIPTVSVLFSGPKVRVYSDASTFTKVWSDNPAWHMLWLLVNSNWRYDELDIQSFVDAAAVCSENVTYTSQYGGTASHARYKSNLILRQRRQAGEIIRGVRQSAAMMVQPNRSTGLLSIAIKGTLAAQQPSAVAGSNYTTAVSSKLRNGTSANGYPCYRWTEDNTISIRGIARPITDTPNRLVFQFQDSENNFSPTNLALSDSDDVERVGQEVASQVQIDSCASYDQASRLGKMLHKEAHRGNPAEDTRGTQWFEIVAGIDCLRVATGQIGMIGDWPRLGLTNQLVRVMSVKGPSKEGLITLTVHWHDDDWYVDSLNQRPDPEYSNPRRDMLGRASYPPCPDLEAPAAGDPYYDPSDKTFALAPEWTLSPEATWRGRMRIRSKIAVNEFGTAQPPQVQPQANVASSGGTLTSGTYYVMVAAKDAGGKYSPLSLPSIGFIASGVTAGVITVPVLWWDDEAVGHAIYAGRTPFLLTLQSETAGTPSSVSVSAFTERGKGAPDQELDALVAMGKVVHHSGILGTQVVAVATGMIEIGGTWTVDALDGYECSILAKANGVDLPILNFAITGNDADGVLAVDPDPSGSVDPGDVIVVRSKPTLSAGGRTWTDPLWANSFNNGDGLNPDEELGKVGYIFAGTGRGLTNLVVAATNTSHTFAHDWLIEPDATSRMTIEHAESLPLDAPYRPISNADPETIVTLSFPIENHANRTMRISLKTMDGSENSCVDALIPTREAYLPGEPPGVVLVTANYSARREDRLIKVNTTAGPVEIQFLSGVELSGLSTLVKLETNGSLDTPPGFDCTLLPANGETFDNGLTSIVMQHKRDAERITGSAI
jgi:hypothetical protein